MMTGSKVWTTVKGAGGRHAMQKSSNEGGSCSNVGQMIAAVHNGLFLAFTPYVTIGSRTSAFHQCCPVLMVLLVHDGLLQ